METLHFNTTIPVNDEKMDVVFVGHVDHGKSTVVGRLLADTGSLPQGKLEQVRLNCERNSRPFEYAFLIDALKDEASQNITIDAARVFFKSTQRRYMILDAPGHIEFIKNMVTGAARAEAALLVIDAQEGVQENSRRHGYLLKMIGIRQIIVLINKMDLVGYQEEVYKRLQVEYGAYLESIGVNPVGYIPVSGREGDNIASLSPRMPWYQGDTVLSGLDSLQKAPPLVNQPLRMPVQDIYRFTLFGDSRRIVAGTLSSGSLCVGDEIVFYPSGKRSKIKTIEAFNRPVQQEAGTGQTVGITLEEQIYIQRGEIATRASEAPPRVSKKLRASIFWLGKEPLVMRKQYLLKLGSAKVRAQVEKINQVQDASSGTILANRSSIEHHEVAEVEFSLQSDLAFDLADTLPGTSRFVIVDQYEICGGGIVLAEISDTESQVRESVIRRNLRWVRGGVTLEQRQERYSQRPALILVTGKQGVGRKRLAQALETRLFQAGRLVYYLGFGSVIYGVDSDLKRIDSIETRQEHIRRLAEVAHILLDSGHILILTAVELTQEDLNLLKTIIDPEFIETIWVGEDITTNIRFDLKIEILDDVESAVTQIRHLLQEHNVVFRV
jgi:bifunctional enzyme CysN/CysC